MVPKFSTSCGQGFFLRGRNKSEGATDLVLQTLAVVSIYYASDQSRVGQDFSQNKHGDGELALFTN